jgi:RNA polymerase sigma-70 factor, ECF subfamily
VGVRSFHDAYPEIARLVRACVRRFGKARHLKDDIVQEALIEIAKAWELYDQARPLEPWVNKITVRKTWNVLNLAYNRRRDPEAGLDDEMSQDRGPEEDALLAEYRALLLELLRPMNEDRRIVFILYEIDEFAMREIAEMLEIPLDTAYSRLKAAWLEIEQRLDRKRKAVGPKGLLGVAPLPVLLEAARQHAPPDLDPEGDEAGPAEDEAPPKGREPPKGGDPDGGAPPMDGGGMPPAAGAPPGIGSSLASGVAKHSAARLLSGGLLLFGLGAGAGAAAHMLLESPPGSEAHRPGALALNESAQRAPDVAPSAERTEEPRPPPPEPTTPPVMASGTARVAKTAVPPIPSARGPAVPPNEPTAVPLSTGSSSTMADAGPVPTATPASLPPDPLTAEAALIVKARTALQEGALDVARQALDEHERDFKNGQMVSERKRLREQLRQKEGQ